MQPQTIYTRWLNSLSAYEQELLAHAGEEEFSDTDEFVPRLVGRLSESTFRRALAEGRVWKDPELDCWLIRPPQPPLEYHQALRTQAKAEARLRQRVRNLAERIRQQGERPRGPLTVDGETYLDRLDAYGGGDSFVVQAEWVWYVRNNGADGDDWSQNNVRTGGAGAIGWRIPRDETIVAELTELEQLLDPLAAERRLPPVERIMAAHFPDLRGSPSWRAPDALTAPPWGVWVERPERAGTFIGLCRDGVYLGAQHSDAYLRYGVYGYIDHEYAVALRYTESPERLQEFVRLLPDWAPIDLIRAVLATPFEQRSTLPTGPLGRYHVRGEGWAATARDALAQGWSLARIEYTPGVTLLHTHTGAHHGIGDRSWQLWSDGRASTGRCLSPTVKGLPPVASELLSAALRQEYWTTDRRWRTLLDAREMTDLTTLGQHRQRSYTSGEERILEKLTVAFAGGATRTFYRVRCSWWSMGEDGDAGDSVYLFEDLQSAQREIERP